MKKLPSKEDLPVTEGPPKQKEPDGQELGGPHPSKVKEILRKQAELKQVKQLLPLKYLDAATLEKLTALAIPQVVSGQVVTALQNLLGDAESPPGSNCNTVTHRCGVGCEAWCDMNWWTALFNAGFQSGGHILMPGVSTDYWFGDAYVPSTHHHFEAAGRFDSKPIPGAGGVHYWSSESSNPGDSHIEAFIKTFGDGTHLNIEGNHNNQCEYVRRADNDSTRAGYCLPVYSSIPNPPKEDDMPTGYAVVVDPGKEEPIPLPSSVSGLFAGCSVYISLATDENPGKAGVWIGDGSAYQVEQDSISVPKGRKLGWKVASGMLYAQVKNEGSKPLSVFVEVGK